MLKNAVLFISSLVSIVTFAAPIVTDVVAKQRYPWNGLVDITCRVSGITGTRNKFYVEAVFPDSGKIKKVVRYCVVCNGEEFDNFSVIADEDYHLVWDAKADLGEVRYTNMIVRVTIVEHDRVQLWEDGPYWATTNIGAEKPEDYGYYFWWGDTVGYKRVNNKWVARDGSNLNFSFDSNNIPTYNKNNSVLQIEGWVSDGVLSKNHDAAYINWGSDWRMPTKIEFEDLNSKCDWTWTTMNGIGGYVVRGKGDYSSVSIFLPAAGCGVDSSFSNGGPYGLYWSSVPNSDLDCANYLDFSSGFHNVYTYNRYIGQVVRPVQDFTLVPIPKNVKATDGTSSVDVEVTWSATIGAMSYEIWRNTCVSSSTAVKIGESNSTSYSDTSALPGTIYYYWVKAVAPVGASKLSVYDSGYIKKNVTHNKVQLWEGGPYWATTNVGADEPWEYGYYFWWGDIVGYKRKNNTWISSDGLILDFVFEGKSCYTYSKGISLLQNEGWISSDKVLSLQHDAAHIQWGDKWRLPTKDEMVYLNDNCIWTWTTTNGVNGYIIQGKGKYSSNSIFLPAAGFGIGSLFGEYGVLGGYWSSRIPDSSNSSEFAWRLFFKSNQHNANFWYEYRNYGSSIRPVQTGDK